MSLVLILFQVENLKLMVSNIYKANVLPIKPNPNFKQNNFSYSKSNSVSCTSSFKIWKKCDSCSPDLACNYIPEYLPAPPTHCPKGSRLKGEREASIKTSFLITKNTNQHFKDFLAVFLKHKCWGVIKIKFSLLKNQVNSSIVLEGTPRSLFLSGKMSKWTHLCSVRTFTADGWLAQYARYKVFICGIRFKKQPPTLCWASGNLETHNTREIILNFTDRRKIAK